MCMTQPETQIPFESLNHQTKQSERLTQSAVCSQSQGAREGPDSGISFCRICAEVSLVCCKPLQVVALKTKVCCLYSLTLCQRRGCPGSRLLLLLVQRFLLAARYFAAKSGYYVSQLCCFATNLGPSRVAFPVPFEPSTTHKCSLSFHLCFTVTVDLALAILKQRCDRFARRSIPTRIVT